MPRSSIRAAQPPLRFLPPRQSPRLRRFLGLLLPLLLRSRGLQRCRIEGVEALARRIEAQQNGRCRLLIGFRHPSTTDPLVMAQLLWQAVPAAARRLGLTLQSPVHSQFLYDRGIPLWAGAGVGWLLSLLGGIPIRRGRVDRPALAAARAVLLDGPHPLAVAPEGANNNLSGQMAPLESGLAQLAFWCAGDLAARQRCEAVEIVPVAIRYHWIEPHWEALDRRLARLMQHLGLELDGAGIGDAEVRYARLQRLGERLLAVLEGLYARRHDLPDVLPASSPAAEAALSPSAQLAARIDALRQRALAVAESLFGLPPRGTLQERCRRIEQAGWERIYREDLAALLPVERSLADWEAREADLRMGHMRLVEYFASVSGAYVAERPSFDRFAEVITILEDAIAWIEERPLPRRPSFGPRTVTVTVGDALPLDGRLEGYHRDRRQAVQELTAAVQDSLESLLSRSGS
ncbi:1-acyl-sn-glycerol-3-phosphate acyltransferase [Synechococcus sp. CS-1328]|uniref:1-acyl-sn-glycerol-3-phosphate acyltransferase n=1 Tax=Synechococcus sp. CS-1328 TaxID=2847976 RepID=UPI00223AC362|nr:1-acyl-sn-glycerol-3-phosphate acyltransferase [Synechococcus sp. CS-1328]MCT0226533.1 1-acyl-sn-glycerol-3-phosphate acyltransferase [Synechococcus sp. CS-1328]